MPVIPNLIERWVLRRNRAPGVMLDLIAGTAFHSASLASNLGFFEHLAQGPKSASDLAELTGCNAEGVRRLLDFLATTKYIVRTGEHYSNSTLTDRWLIKSSPGNVVNFVDNWNSLLVETWAESLEHSVKSGTVKVHFQDWMSLKPGRWAKFTESMTSIAAKPAEEIAALVDLPSGARRLLDIGGNHGLYSAAFCRRYPQLTATIFDVPEALDHEIADQNPQLVMRPGDIRTDDPGSDYDATLISNLIHYFTPKECSALIKRAASALAPGGMMIVSDQSGNAKGSPLIDTFLKMMSLHYFIVTGSDVYSANTVISWMEAAGCRHMKTIKLRTAPGQMLIIAQRES
ncbi:MAG TPA: methyltransferase [Allosphingosinicella sp.]|nr:methyltransferase [Allosphingosinicella sp.]